MDTGHDERFLRKKAVVLFADFLYFNCRWKSVRGHKWSSKVKFTVHCKILIYLNWVANNSKSDFVKSELEKVEELGLCKTSGGYHKCHTR